MVRASVLALAIIAFAGSSGWPGEAAAKPQATSGRRLSAIELVAEEERWVYRPSVGRPDFMIDREAEILARVERTQRLEERRRQGSAARDPSGKPESSDDRERLLAWGRGEDERVREALIQGHYEEAMRIADAAIKQLEPQISHAGVAAIIVSLRTYRTQAEEAKIREDAQAAFEALKIRVLGILWSQDGVRLAIVDGEQRALAVNDRVKDCVILHIDQDRVDFRFVYQRRRFEFPVYVDLTTRPLAQQR